jgi:hypothetical protein
MMVLLGHEAQVEAQFGAFRIVLILTQDSARFAPNIPQAQKMFWTHTIEIHGDVGHVESHFGPFRDSINIGERLVHGLRQMYHRLRNHFGCTQWYF